MAVDGVYLPYRLDLPRLPNLDLGLRASAGLVMATGGG